MSLTGGLGMTFDSFRVGWRGESIVSGNKLLLQLIWFAESMEILVRMHEWLGKKGHHSFIIINPIVLFGTVLGINTYLNTNRPRCNNSLTEPFLGDGTCRRMASYPNSPRTWPAGLRRRGSPWTDLPSAESSTGPGLDLPLLESSSERTLG